MLGWQAASRAEVRQVQEVGGEWEAGGGGGGWGERVEERGEGGGEGVRGEQRTHPPFR